MTSSRGEALSPHVRRDYERFFRTDLSRVRVHTDDSADRAAQALSAQAFTRDSDVYFATDRFQPQSSEGRWLLAHELTHTHQSGSGAPIRRQEAPGPPDPQINRLRRLLSDDEENNAIDLMGRLTADQTTRVLSDHSLRSLAVDSFDDEEMVRAVTAMDNSVVPSLQWLFAEGVDYGDFRTWFASPHTGLNDVLGNNEIRDGFVSACDDEEMAEVVQQLPGTLAQKLDWLRAEGAEYSQAREVIGATPAAERPAIYSDTSLRDWFVDICFDYQMQSAVMDIGGRLHQQLSWMRAEGADWLLLRIMLGQSTITDADREEVIADSRMRSFFRESLNDREMSLALDLLGGTLSQKMEWLHEEGSTDVPREAEESPPEIAPRDAALIDALDRRSELFRRFEAAEAARRTVAAQRGARGAARDPGAAAEAMEMGQENLRAAESALSGELSRQGYSSEAQFVDEIRRFQAFFHGFALQTAFLMLRENRSLAESEGTRYRGADMNALYAALAPVRELLPSYRAAQQSYADSLDEVVGGSRHGVRESAESPRHRADMQRIGSEMRAAFQPLIPRYPVLANPSAQNFVIMNADDRTLLQTRLIAQTTSVLENIEETRRALAEDSDKVWQMAPVISRAKLALGVTEGSAMDGIVRRKMSEVTTDEVFQQLAIAALALGLGLLSGGTGTVAVLAGAGALAVSGWSAYEHWQEFSLQQAALGSALDPARALADVEPSILWLALDIAGVFLDLHGLVTAVRGSLGTAARAIETAENAAAAQARLAELERAAAQAALQPEVRSAMREGADLVDAARRAAQRQIARKATLESAPELVARIRAIPGLAEDTAATAGLVRMGDSAATAAIEAFRTQPLLLRRLGSLAESEAAVASGVARLRGAVADDAAFAALLRDGLIRRDARRAQDFLSAIGDGHITDDQLRSLATAASNPDPARRAAAISDAVERETSAATGFPAPGSQAERDALEATRGLDANAIRNPEVELRAEWRVVERSNPLPIDDPDYIAEVTLPNGHRWRQNRAGGWCRFSNEFCPTRAVLEAMGQRATAIERNIAEYAEHAATASAEADELPGIIERLTLNRRPGHRAINLDALSPHEREVLESIFSRADDPPIEELTLAQLQAARGRPGAEATRWYELQEAAIEELRNATRPLYDKVRAASPTARIRDQVLRRARGLDEVSGLPPVSGAVDVDHIVPLRRIMDMPGFRNLPWEDQVAVVNMIENLKAVDSAANRSRQALSWSEWPGRSVYSHDAVERIVQAEADAAVRLQAEIDRRLAASGRSVTR